MFLLQLYFVGSASSFYFVYDFCLYNGMTSLGGSALRYLPLLTGAATLLPLLGLKLCMSKRRSTIKYHGLWMIVLLSFSHVVYTSMSLLNCPSITDSNGHTSPRWFVNGEVECFSGSHLYLGVAAGIILLLAFLLTVTTTVLPLTQARHKRQWVTKLSSTLSFSYRDKCEWWASVELSRRIFLIFVLLTFPRNTTLVILVLAGILALFGHAHPYKHRLTNISEVAVLTNFIILLALRQTPYVIDEYFQFPSEEGEGGCGDNVPRGVATISWILLPLYYLPVLVFAVLIIARIVLYGAPPLWARVKKIKIRRREEGGFHDNSLSMSHRRPASSMPTTHTSLRIARGVTHGIASVIRSNKKKKSWRNNGLELRATTADDHEDLIDPFL
ncbi:hypothetical protein GBAR_LOCUS31079 [Geodia barretti]|uniref:Uncharacterized protein n=1 Tax=Geodia barretti TaxID=519541 RepID=A0AA35TYW7_GEOBA|nr:hypothetical protein GBAR_LOCUS31079 [Geodia barretti]